MLAAMTIFAAFFAPIDDAPYRAATGAPFCFQDSVTCVSNTQTTAPEPERMTGA